MRNINRPPILPKIPLCYLSCVHVCEKWGDRTTWLFWALLESSTCKHDARAENGLSHIKKKPGHVASLICPQIYEEINKTWYLSRDISLRKVLNWTTSTGSACLTKHHWWKQNRLAAFFFPAEWRLQQVPLCSSMNTYVLWKKYSPLFIPTVMTKKKEVFFLPNREGLISRLPYTTENHFNLFEKGCSLLTCSLLLHESPLSWLTNVPYNQFLFSKYYDTNHS